MKRITLFYFNLKKNTPKKNLYSEKWNRSPFFNYCIQKSITIFFLLLIVVSDLTAQEKNDFFLSAKKLNRSNQKDSIGIFINPYNVKALWIATLSKRSVQLSRITLFLNDHSELPVNDSCISLFKNGTLINFPADYFYAGNSFITQIKFNYTYTDEFPSPATLNFTAIYNLTAYSVIKDCFYKTYYELPKERIYLPGVQGRTAIPYEWNDTRANWSTNLGAKNN
ncbi:MAG: hypothetical protein HEQ40_13130 [Lacibacter sp.]|jgi:hypothetical protein